jgi:hypothetical protein
VKQRELLDELDQVVGTVGPGSVEIPRTLGTRERSIAETTRCSHEPWTTASQD